MSDEAWLDVGASAELSAIPVQEVRDMKNNEEYVRHSKFLHDGAVALVRRSADMARVMIESALGQGALVRGGRKGHQLDTERRLP